MIMKTVPTSTRVVIGYAMKRGTPFHDGKSMETEATTWSEFPNGEKVILEEILASEERKKSKRAGLWESNSGIWVAKSIIWVKSFEIE